MSKTEYHVVIGCPARWSEDTVNILAALLESVSVCVWKLVDGKIEGKTIVQEMNDDA